jgi:hypothetical protein
LSLQFSPPPFGFLRFKGSDAYGHNPKVRGDNGSQQNRRVWMKKFVIERRTRNDCLDYMNRTRASVRGEQVTGVVQPLLRLSERLGCCPLRRGILHWVPQVRRGWMRSSSDVAQSRAIVVPVKHSTGCLTRFHRAPLKG